MASQILGHTTLRDDDDLCAAARAVDARRILDTIVQQVPRRLRESATAPNSAGVHEIFLDGAGGSALMRWLEATAPADAAALHKLVEAAEAAARVALLKIGYTTKEARSATFSTRSLLARVNSPAQPAQPPHVDAKFGAAQFLVTLSEAARPTLVFSKEQSPLLAYELSPDARLCAAMLPLALPRAALEAAMAPAVSEKLAPGALVALAGPVIHGGPATDAGEDRILFFMTSSLPESDAEEYDRNYQALPFIWCDERSDLEGFVRSVREWTSHEPWHHFWNTPRFCAAVRALCEAPDAPPSAEFVRLFRAVKRC